MLTVMTTLVCAGAAACMWLFVSGHDGQQAAVLMHLLHFSSIITAIMSLLLLWAVLKMRHEAPPQNIVVFALVVAALPILAALL
jgi:hypothetical protein